MVSTHKNLRDCLALEHLRACVPWAVQQTILKRILHRGLEIAQHTRNQPHDGVHQHESRKLSSGKDVIADRYFPVHVPRSKPFVHTAIMAANQDEMLLQRQFVRDMLRQAFSVWSKKNDRTVAIVFFDSLYAAFQRLRHQNHAAATTKWRVIYCSTRIIRPLTKIVWANCNQILTLRAPHNADGKRRKKSSGKSVITSISTSVASARLSQVQKPRHEVERHYLFFKIDAFHEILHERDQMLSSTGLYYEQPS